ncbi:sulfite exporter TauE/SafE family protein [Marinilabilia salmonicolor]|uniref:sulfite exporter TauE/SafE family protein n=1 Tax=Marinilabilia salmonicolor TaxID=989 RepID=UPI00029A486C|nr:sulfite exporter TauE/SafE family protein [Marinilabilia salmonicolor]
MTFFSTIEPIYYLLPLAGLIVGLFGTILGGGGGFFFLPILTLIIGAPAQTAVITSLVATLPICIVGAAMHYRKGNLDIRTGSAFAIVGILGAFAGAAIANYIAPQLLKTIFGIYAVGIGGLMFMNVKQRPSAKTNKKGKPMNYLKKPAYGFLAGMITGTFGTSGTAPVLAGLFAARLPVKMVIGTSLFVLVVNTSFAAGAHFLMGQIDLTLVALLTAGSIPGALLGPVILSNIKTDNSESSIKYVYAAVMVLIGILMIIA